MITKNTQPYTRARQQQGEQRLRLLVTTCLSLLLGLAVGVNMTIGAVPACM